MHRRTPRIALAIAVLVAIAGCALLTPSPVARFDVAAPVLYAGESTLLDAGPSVGSASIVEYSWSLGNGETASGRRVTVAYNLPGRYTIELVVTDAEGRTSKATEEIIVYVRAGTRLFSEDFSAGPTALGRWPLDPTWANANESTIEHISGGPGYCLLVNSGNDNWHRRYAPVKFPPLRVGQRLVFTCRAMTLQSQRGHTFVIAPGRRDISDVAGSLPYFEFTSDGGGAYVVEPTSYGPGVGHPIAFKPSIYRWHTYTIVYTHDSYELSIDGTLLQTGPVSIDLTTGGDWFILLGEESSTEACVAYFDDIEISVAE